MFLGLSEIKCETSYMNVMVRSRVMCKSCFKVIVTFFFLLPQLQNAADVTAAAGAITTIPQQCSEQQMPYLPVGRSAKPWCHVEAT